MTAPSSRPPAGVPDSGHAKHAVVAIALVIGIGAIFAWRSLSNRGQESAPIPTVSAAQSAPAPTNPKLDDVPPPPPPEEKPTSGGGGPRIVYVPGGGCDGKCSQQYATPELGQALQARASAARRCYNQALGQDSSLKGHVTIGVRVASNGNVCSANVLANDMGSPGVAQCAANVFRATGSFPAPRGGCVDANVPLSFVPQGQ